MTSIERLDPAAMTAPTTPAAEAPGGDGRVRADLAGEPAEGAASGAVVPRVATVELFGCPVARLDLEQATALAAAYAKAGDGRLRLITGVNLDTLLKVQEDPVFAGAVLSADLLVPDGVSTLWLTGLLGGPRLEHRVPAIDVADALMPIAARDGLSVFLLGARPDVVDRAAQALARRHPGLRIAGRRDGYFSEGEEEAIAAEIAASGARVLLLGMSSPKKEMFIARRRHQLGAMVAISVGSAFDIACGDARRAPPWMQRHALEWLWRVLQEPRRIGGRVLESRRFVRHVWRALRAGRGSRVRAAQPSGAIAGACAAVQPR